jgi:hypothetical protein
MRSKSSGFGLLNLALTLFTVAGCSPASEQPLSGEQDSIVDQRLLGRWQVNQGTERAVPFRLSSRPSICEIKQMADSSTGMEIVNRSQRSQDAGQSECFYATQIGGRRYLSLDLRAGNSDSQTIPGIIGYYILQYRFIDDDTVEFRGLDNRVIAEAIANRELAGKIFGKSPDWDSRAVISDSPENMARYFERHADKCFPDDAERRVVLRRSN